MSRQWLTQRICDRFGIPLCDGDIGLEIEIEGGDSDLSWSGKVNWKTVDESSLRNGKEFILRKPNTLAELDVSLAEFGEWSRGRTFVKSLRTSTHIHVNVLSFTVAEVLASLVAYWLVEQPLVAQHGHNREGNLHCLRVSDADGIIDALLNDFKDESPFGYSGSEDLRYGAVNLSAIRKFGSLEFRFMRCMTDPVELKFWCTEMHNLVHSARKIGTPREVLRMFERQHTSEFLHSLFSDDMVNVLMRWILHNKRSRKIDLCSIVPKLSAISKATRSMRLPKIEDERTEDES